MNSIDHLFKDNEVTNTLYNKLLKDYNKQITKASDKNYTHLQLEKDFADQYRIIQNEYAPYNWETLNKIEDVLKRSRISDLTIVLKVIFKNNNSKKITEVYRAVSSFFGYYKFSRFISEQYTMVQKKDEIVTHAQNKIEWLGTQKELGELFITLKQKGWIKDFTPKFIKNNFTKSDTIDQILKPSLNNEKGNYEGIYTKSYRPKYDTIRENPLKPKKVK
jgi:hypothetical protein